MKRPLLWLPLVAFLLVIGVVARALIRPADHDVHSQMVGKALPTFSLPAMVPGKPGLGSAVFDQGQPRLLNVFASWCIPCMAESPQLMALARAGVKIDGVAVRDTGPNIRQFLSTYGDPYERIGDDRQSAVQLELGSSGVPESFLIDGHGRIIAQHIGDIRAEDVPGILQKLREAQ